MPSSPLPAAVPLGFALLAVASGVRYVMRHDPGEHLLVLSALLLTTAAFLLPRFAGDRLPSAWRSGFLWAALATWCALVILAPSFAWCSLPAFFLCRAAFPGPVARLSTAILAAATAVGLFRLSGWSDLAMLLGPVVAGVLLTFVHERLDEARKELAVVEREAGAAAERARVSREVHDTVTQGLASSLLLLEAAQRSEPEAARGKLEDAASLLRESLVETRGLVHELAAPGLDSAPLPEALLRAVRRYAEDARLVTGGTTCEVPAEIRHALLRLVQSAASNAHRHAGPAQVTLSVVFLPGSVTVDLHDTGQGFDPAAVPAPGHDGGYGLRAMRQRIEQLGGSFSVESTPGEGTVVAAELPLPQPPVGASAGPGTAR